MSYSPYESCTKCAGRAQPGAQVLLKVLLEKYPYTRSMGIYNCRYVAGTRTLSNHSCGCAIDLGIPVRSNGRAREDLGNPIVQFLDSISSTIGLTEQIYNRVRYDAKSPRGRYYGGAHPHYDHIHLSITKAKGKSLTRADLVGMVGGTENIMLAPSQKGDRGDHVAALQTMLSGSGFDPGPIDGIYGAKTSKALLALRKSIGSQATSGDVFNHWAYEQLHQVHAARHGGGPGNGLTANEVDARINSKIAAHAKNPDAHHA